MNLEFLVHIWICLGFLQVCYGSILYILVHIFPGEAADNLRDIWDLLRQQYEAMGTHNRFSLMKLTMFSPSSGSCKLKGTAADVRAFGKHCNDFWMRINMNMQDALFEHSPVTHLPHTHTTGIKQIHTEANKYMCTCILNDLYSMTMKIYTDIQKTTYAIYMYTYKYT